MKFRKVILSLIAALTLPALVLSGAACSGMCSLGIHSYGDNWEVTTPATCTTPGVKRRVCLSCGQGNVTEEIPALGHSFGAWHDVVSTCTEHTQEAVCERCSEKKTRAAAVTGHNYKNGVCVNCGGKQPTIDDSSLDALTGTYGKTYFERYGNRGEVELYGRLDDAAKKFHLGETVATRDSSGRYVVAEINYKDLGLTTQRAIAVWSIYRYDHPMYFWTSTSLSYNTEKINLLCADDYYQNDTRAAVKETIYTQLADWIATIGNSPTDYSKALAAHDIIVGSMRYAYDEEGKAETAEWAHSIAGAFVRHEGVCEAYAKAFQLILNYFGIENILVGGEGVSSDAKSSEAHLWNLVNIGGNWYWCDLTWDDVGLSNFGVSYHNFMVSENQNVNWRDWGSGAKEGKFLDRHIPTTEHDTGVDFMYSLPARARNPYSGDDAVRSTFEVKEGAATATYSVNGYDKAQLVKVEGFKEFNVPDFVEHGGVQLSVLSIGAIDGRVYVGESVLDDTIEKFTVSASIQAIYEGALVSSSVKEYAVAAGNRYFEADGGALFTQNRLTLAFYPSARESASYTLPVSTKQIAGKAIVGARNLSVLNLGGCAVTLGWVNTGFGLDIKAQQASYTWGHIASETAQNFKVTATTDNPLYKIVDDALFSRENKLLLVMDKSLRSYTLPKGTTAIDGYAFIGMTRLQGAISYEGTAAEWRAVERATNWSFVDGAAKVNKVICSDTTISV